MFYHICFTVITLFIGFAYAASNEKLNQYILDRGHLKPHFGLVKISFAFAAFYGVFSLLCSFIIHKIILYFPNWSDNISLLEGYLANQYALIMCVASLVIMGWPLICKKYQVQSTLKEDLDLPNAVSFAIYNLLSNLKTLLLSFFVLGIGGLVSYFVINAFGLFCGFVAWYLFFTKIVKEDSDKVHTAELNIYFTPERLTQINILSGRIFLGCAIILFVLKFL